MSALEQRRAILREIAALGPVLPGSITERLTRCQTEGCHCRADPPQLHGPYFVWTHRSGGRQITTSITSEEADLLRPLIAEDRRLHRLVHELETLGAQETAQRNRQPRSLGSRADKTGITAKRNR
ncbi:MAG TPA: DUF6788 family protein [Acidimicrobiales bacterium]|nr:DUF6788 family protein [Acidimicrobiales bacterium]